MGTRILPLALLAIVAGACTDDSANARDAPVPAAAAAPAGDAEHPFRLTAVEERGREVYETVCWSCHGTAGRGDGPAVRAGTVAHPPDFIAGGYADLTAGELQGRFHALFAGDATDRPHMQYVVSLLNPDRFRDALAFVPALAYPPEIGGSALAGKAMYAYRCAPCHGTSGRGDGPAAAELKEYRPADFTTDTLVAARDYDALFTRVKEGGQRVHGSSMPPWGVVFSDGEIWDLVAYVSSFQPVLSAPPGR